jgi:hypothetical protein
MTRFLATFFFIGGRAVLTPVAFLRAATGRDVERLDLPARPLEGRDATLRAARRGTFVRLLRSRSRPFRVAFFFFLATKSSRLRHPDTGPGSAHLPVASLF